MNYEELIWEYLISLGFTEEAAAGIMGNTHAESANKPNNAQNSGNAKTGLSDDQYTQKIDNDDHSYLCTKNGVKYYGQQAFIYDSIGYGLCQWTYWSRKKALLEFAKKNKTSISNLYTQVDYLVKELKLYGLLNKIKKSKDIRYVTKIILTEFEKPASVINKTEAQVEAVVDTRYNYSMTIYKKYHQSIENDLETLVKYNVINSPDYWKNNAYKLEYLPTLYRNMAMILKELCE